MIAATRQDLQSALDRMKSNILGSMMSRGDAQSLVTSLRSSILQDLHDLHAENQQMIRQFYSQSQQLGLRASSIEHQMAVLQQLLVRMVEQQNRILGQMQK